MQCPNADYYYCCCNQHYYITLKQLPAGTHLTISSLPFPPLTYVPKITTLYYQVLKFILQSNFVFFDRDSPKPLLLQIVLHCLTDNA